MVGKRKSPDCQRLTLRDNSRESILNPTGDVNNETPTSLGDGEDLGRQR